MSDAKAAELRAAELRAAELKAAELKAAVESTEWELSRRERGIIERLNAKQARAPEVVAQAGLFAGAANV